MRICSLVPGATEILFSLGLGDEVVGVTHECDWPPEAAEQDGGDGFSSVQTGDLTSAESTGRRPRRRGEGKPLYAIEEDRWEEVEADVVITQELCHVCAVSTDEVVACCARTRSTPS